MLKYLVAGFLVFGIFGCATKEEVSKTTEPGTSEMQGHEGHGGHQHGTEAAKEREMGIVMRTAPADEVGKDAFCLVMSKKFKVKSDTPVADYKGKSHYLCCAACTGMFSKDPDKYVK